MAKNAKRKNKTQHSVKLQHTETPMINKKGVQSGLLLGVMLIILLVILKSLVIDHLSPQGVDVLASVAVNKQVTDWQKESDKTALWNPNLFAGMPRYQRMGPVTFSADTILNWLGSFTSGVFIYYLLAGIGAFLLLRFLKLSPLIAFTGAMMFILLPHYKSLYLVGHFAKFKAIMFLPWITLSFLYFLEKRDMLSAALFTLAFGNQIRTQHYQIVFYTAVMIFSIGIYPIIKDVLEKKYSRFAKSSGLIIVAVFLAIMMAAQPLFLAKEYLPWSKRGKTTINIQQPEKNAGIDKTNGVTMEYATQWSTAPGEIFTWIIPRFFGGMSGETYTGDAVKQLKGRQIPGYWGYMPFTQSYEYMGALTLILGIIGLIYNRKNPLIIGLALFAGFLILLSFGRHASWFYSIFYDYVPFFNKFRAPMMSVTVTSFIMTLFAALGLASLGNVVTEKFSFKEYRTIFIILGSFIGLGIILWLLSQGFSFLKEGENYQQNVLDILVTIRKEMFENDLLRYMALVILASVAILTYLRKKIPHVALIILFSLISIIDLLNVQGREQKDLVNIKKLEANYFQETQTDEFLKKDPDVFRVYPFGNMFGDNRWAYYHETIGGYTAIKMYTIEELVENNLKNGAALNTRVMQILNVKYVISQKPLDSPELEPVFSEQSVGLNTYRFKNNLSRGFFVGSYQKIEDEYARVKMLNNPAFKPDSVAILETDLNTQINYPDSSYCQVKESNPNFVSFEVYTDKQALFVMSEPYYPPGWKIFMDTSQVKSVYKTDHAIQSIVVPAGKHNIEMRFEPDSYTRDVRYASLSLSVLYIVIAASVVGFIMRKNKKDKNISEENSPE